MTDKERLKIILDNSIYDHNFEEFTVPLKDMDWLIEQAERAQELEENCSHLRKSFQRQRNKAVEGWEKVGKLENKNDQAMTRVHQLASIAIDQEKEYKDLWDEKRLAEEECERYKKMFSEEKGKSIALYIENERFEQALEFGIKYLQASNIGQVQIVVQAMKEALENRNE